MLARATDAARRIPVCRGGSHLTFWHCGCRFKSSRIDLAANTANQVLVAAPGAGKQIWVFGIFMMADTAAGTVTLQDEDDTALSGTMAVGDEDGWVLPMSGNFAMPWIKVATNKALEADTGACTVDGIITYAVVSV